MILLHGFPDTPYGWADTAAVLNAAGYRTVVPYLRGYHPDTIVPGRGYGTAAIVEDAHRAARRARGARRVLVGHDWGAIVTYGAAERAPQRFRAVARSAYPTRHAQALAGPRLGGTPLPGPAPADSALAATPARLRLVDTLMRRWAPDWTGPESRSRASPRSSAAFADPAVLDAATAYYRDTSGWDFGPSTQPALLVGGTHHPERFAGSGTPQGVARARSTSSWSRAPGTGRIARRRRSSTSACSRFSARWRSADRLADPL